MTIADQFAQLMAGVDLQAMPGDLRFPSNVPGYKPMDQVSLAKTRTVYSVGEAVKGKERVTHAKLGAGSF